MQATDPIDILPRLLSAVRDGDHGEIFNLAAQLYVAASNRALLPTPADLAEICRPFVR